MDRGDEKRDAGGEQHDPLEDAQGAGLEPDGELKVITEGEHPRTSQESGEVADSSGKQKPDHRPRAYIRMACAAFRTPLSRG
jgi:hypothetical protein